MIVGKLSGWVGFEGGGRETKRGCWSEMIAAADSATLTTVQIEI